MTKEEVSLRSKNDNVEKSFRIFEVALKVETAELWNVKLQVISELRSKVWVNSASLKSRDCSRLVSVQSDHCLADVNGLFSTVEM